MKTLGKALANKVATILIVLVILIGGFYFIKSQFPNWFGGTTDVEYSFVIKKFAKKSELIVAGAEVETTANKTFKSEALKDWPDWTKPITSVFISRNLKIKLPVKTEFKLELEGVTKNDVTIKNNVLTFKTPLVVNVDSQQEGEIVIIKSSNGLVDKTVDAFTSGKKAQEFLSDKSQDAIYATSKKVMNNDDRQEKVVKYAKESLENLINLGSDQKITVDLDKSDLKFVNVDPER